MVRRVHGMLRLRASPRFPPGGLGGVCVTRAPQPCKPRVETSGQVVPLAPRHESQAASAGRRRTNAIAIPRFPPGASCGGVCATRASCPCKPRVETSGQVVLLTLRLQTASSEQRRRRVFTQTPYQRNRDPPVSTGGFLGGVCVMRVSHPCKPRVETSGQVVLLTPYSRTDITTTRQTPHQCNRDSPVSTGGFLGGVRLTHAPPSPSAGVGSQVLTVRARLPCREAISCARGELEAARRIGLFSRSVFEND